jgi:hypothetical protein
MPGESLCESRRAWQEDVADKRLRIAVEERKPGRLNLHHQAMPGLEGLKDVIQAIVDEGRLIGNESVGLAGSLQKRPREGFARTRVG